MKRSEIVLVIEDYLNMEDKGFKDGFLLGNYTKASNILHLLEKKGMLPPDRLVDPERERWVSKEENAAGVLNKEVFEYARKRALGYYHQNSWEPEDEV